MSSTRKTGRIRRTLKNKIENILVDYTKGYTTFEKTVEIIMVEM